MGRAKYGQALKELHHEIITMGNMVETAIDDAIKAFKEHNLEVCEAIIDNDENVDQMEKSIESRCLWLIAREQPVASDLRTITTALKLVTDMERIGDHAVDIAELTMRIDAKNTFADDSHITDMAAVAIEMVHDSVTSFVNYDLELAKEVEAKDDVVDGYFNMIKHELVEIFTKQPENLDSAVDFLQIAKYLERIADHAVNICEWVQFSQTGEHKDTLIF